MNPFIFRKNDIRGHADDDLPDPVVERLGSGLGQLIPEFYREPRPNPLTVAVGRDMRLHSERIAAAMCRGLQRRGIHVIDLGMCPTPVCYFAQATMDVLGSIMVTGSHNPPAYNGLKITLKGKPVIEELIQSLRVITAAGKPPPAADPGSYTIRDANQLYIKHLAEHFHGLGEFNISRNQPITIVADAGNGTAGLVLAPLLNRLGFDHHLLYGEPDGTLPHHHPDPTVEENLADLRREVAARGAHLGVAYDGDADRLGVVDDHGRIVWGDQLLIVFAAEILKRHPGAAIVADVKCSQTLFDAIERMGGTPIMWKTGHSLIKKKMVEEDALLAGEMSGHLFFKHRYFGYDDAIYATFRLLEIMAAKGSIMGDYHFSEVADFLPPVCNTPELRADCPDQHKFRVVERLREQMYNCWENPHNGNCPQIRRLITIDGVRAIFDNGWGLVRASNTQPVLVLRFEAENTTALNRIQRYITRQVKTAIREVSSD
ncbi:MAG: phosphomannomutase/phosphoglucomutase [Deltaproteobacteria bacterium]|nr:phosphomannomutase/phosphoglucomutase [Candidatus Anaeroferrophillacea bacterium]